jgi:hypothetical protein
MRTKTKQNRMKLNQKQIKAIAETLPLSLILTSTILMAIPYPTTKAARSRIYGDAARNFIDSPAPIFGLLFLPV